MWFSKVFVWNHLLMNYWKMTCLLINMIRNWSPRPRLCVISLPHKKEFTSGSILLLPPRNCDIWYPYCPSTSDNAFGIIKEILLIRTPKPQWLHRFENTNTGLIASGLEPIYWNFNVVIYYVKSHVYNKGYHPNIQRI